MMMDPDEALETLRTFVELVRTEQRISATVISNAADAFHDLDMQMVAARPLPRKWSVL